MTEHDFNNFKLLWLGTCEASANSKLPSDIAVTLIFDDLRDYSLDVIKAALAIHRKTNSFAPTPASIIAIVNDNSRIKALHLSADEAWALCPKSEADSVVWTAQIGKAYYIAQDAGGNETAKRMAFKAAYERVVNEAVRHGVKPHWVLSSGTDKMLKDRALQEAIELGRITPNYARQVAGYIQRAKTPSEAIAYIEKDASTEAAKQAIQNLKLLLGA